MRITRIAPHRGRLAVAIAALAIAVPSPALGAAGSGPVDPNATGYVTSSDPFVVSSGAVDGVTFRPLINSGEEAFGTLFEGIPDGIGVVPAPAPHGYVDLYVNHEQSRVPFGGFADFNDSSVSRVRVDIATKRILDLSVALSADEGFIRFCSSFMAGPEQGFPHYTLLTNEELNDPLAVPAGAVYGADPAFGGDNVRQAGYSVYLDTANGKIGVLAGAGRHNHENQVIVPGGWDGIVSLSGDDTFTFPSTPERPNLSQLYAFSSKNWKSYQKDEGTLLAFRVTGANGHAVDPADPMNGANDYFDISPGDDFMGEFIPVPADVARGDTADLPQDALEDWSNANNVFQFVRVEDIAYDPDSPRTVYFADTGNSRLVEDPGTGRLYRASSGGSFAGGPDLQDGHERERPDGRRLIQRPPRRHVNRDADPRQCRGLARHAHGPGGHLQLQQDLGLLTRGRYLDPCRHGDAAAGRDERHRGRLGLVRRGLVGARCAVAREPARRGARPGLRRPGPEQRGRVHGPP